MTLRIVEPRSYSINEKLAAILPEDLKVDVYFPALDDPMLFGPRCRIPGCEGNRVLRCDLCNLHMARATRRRGEAVSGSKTSQRLTMKNQGEWMEMYISDLQLNGGPVKYNHTGFNFSGLPISLANEMRMYLYAIRTKRTFIARLPEFMVIYRAAMGMDPPPESLFENPEKEAMAFLRSKTPLPLPYWLSQYEKNTRVSPTIRFIKEQIVLSCFDLPRMEKDVWDLSDFGMVPKVGSNNAQINFTRIHPLWLRTWVKRYAEYRLKTGIWWSSVRGDVSAWQRVSKILEEWPNSLNSPADLTRPVLEFLLERINCGENFRNHGKTGVLSAIRKIMQTHRDLDWDPPLPQSAVIRRNEAADPQRSLPQPIDPFILSQLMDPSNLSKMPPQLRHCLIIARHHGLRVSSLLTLKFSPVRYSEHGAILMYRNTKLNREAEQPIMKQEVLDAILNQQKWVEENYPHGSKWLFPAIVMNLDGEKPWNAETLHIWFRKHLEALNISDRTGKKPQIVWHQFRDTFATELLENEVEPYVIAAWLDHKDTWSLDLYAKQSATSLRRHLEKTPRFSQKGEIIQFPEESETISDADFMRDSVRMASGTVANGYCTLPAREDCPHMNACFTCPSESYVTTPDFLPHHLKHLEETQMLIVTNEARGHTRLVQKNKLTESHLVSVISGLLKWADSHPEDITGTRIEKFLLMNETELNVIRKRGESQEKQL